MPVISKQTHKKLWEEARRSVVIGARSGTDPYRQRHFPHPYSPDRPRKPYRPEPPPKPAKP